MFFFKKEKIGNYRGRAKNRSFESDPVNEFRKGENSCRGEKVFEAEGAEQNGGFGTLERCVKRGASHPEEVSATEGGNLVSI